MSSAKEFLEEEKIVVSVGVVVFLLLVIFFKDRVLLWLVWC